VAVLRPQTAVGMEIHYVAPLRESTFPLLPTKDISQLFMVYYDTCRVSLFRQELFERFVEGKAAVMKYALVYM